MKRTRFPSGWNDDRVRSALEHYESQTEAEAIADDEAAFRKRGQTVMVVPKGLVPAITQLIERRTSPARHTGSRQPGKSEHKTRS